MALEDQVKAISELGKLGENIPGLSVDKVVENLAKKDESLEEYLKLIEDEKQDNLERGMSEEEADKAAEEAKKQAVETLKGNIKPAVEEEVIMMKQEYKIAKEALDSIPTEASTAIATAAIPPAISAPPSAANPLYTLAMATQTKKSLLKTINIVIASLTKVMMIANRLKFELPESIVNLVKVLGIATSALSIIPG
jgi:uncharacterized protein (DUF2384 family)